MSDTTLTDDQIQKLLDILAESTRLAALSPRALVLEVLERDCADDPHVTELLNRVMPNWTNLLSEDELEGRVPAQELYLVWSREHGAWWGPNCAGYTLEVASAGRYTKKQAEDICDHARSHIPGEPPPEVMVLEHVATKGAGVGSRGWHP